MSSAKKALKGASRIGKKVGKQAIRASKGVLTAGLSETKGGRRLLAKAAAPVLGTAGFVIGGPAGAALGAALGTRLSQGQNADWKRVLRSGAIGFGAGAGVGAGVGGLKALAGKGLSSIAGMGKGSLSMLASGAKSFLGGGMPGGGSGEGGGSMIGDLAGLYGGFQSYRGSERALDDLAALEDQQRNLISQQTDLAGLDPAVADRMKNQARQDLRAAQAERGIYESGVAAAQEAELMPQIDQQQRAWQLQQLAGISPQYQPLMQSALARAGMYGSGADVGSMLAGGGSGGGNSILERLAGGVGGGLESLWDKGKDFLGGLFGGDDNVSSYSGPLLSGSSRLVSGFFN